MARGALNPEHTASGMAKSLVVPAIGMASSCALVLFFLLANEWGGLLDPILSDKVTYELVPMFQSYGIGLGTVSIRYIVVAAAIGGFLYHRGGRKFLAYLLSISIIFTTGAILLSSKVLMMESHSMRTPEGNAGYLDPAKVLGSVLFVSTVVATILAVLLGHMRNRSK